MVEGNMGAVSLNFGEKHGAREFHSWDSLEKFLSSERAKWEWLDNPAARNPGNVRALVKQAFVEIEQDLVRLRDASARLDKIENAVAVRYDPKGGILRLSSGVDGTAILDVRDAAGDEAGAFAYAFSQHRVTIAEATRLDQLRGALLMALPGMGKPTDLARRMANERANNKSAQISAMDRLEKVAEGQQQRFDGLLKRGGDLALKALRSRSESWRAAQVEWAANATKALGDIEEVKKTFEEHMTLQAPVQYWRTKASEHRTRERINALWVAIFFATGAVLLGFAYYYAANLLLAAGRQSATVGASQPTALYVVVAGALAALTTLVFWVGRLLTKLFLSEHHLRNDASERAVMTTTYLALTREGLASDADRQIILNALFRNTPDGIVKEDGAGDLALQAALAKFLVRS